MHVGVSIALYVLCAVLAGTHTTGVAATTYGIEASHGRWARSDDCGCNIAGSWDIDSCETSNPQPSKPVGYNVADCNPHNNPICECAAFP